MSERSRKKGKVERGSSLMFTRDMPYFAGILLTHVRTHGKTTRQWKSTFIWETFGVLDKCYFMVACEQALLFGQAKRASREHASAQIGELARRLLYGRWSHMKVPVYQYNLSRSRDRRVLFFLFCTFLSLVFYLQVTMSTTASHLMRPFITIASTLLQAQNDPTPVPC